MERLAELNSLLNMDEKGPSEALGMGEDVAAVADQSEDVQSRWQGGYQKLSRTADSVQKPSVLGKLKAGTRTACRMRQKRLETYRKENRNSSYKENQNKIRESRPRNQVGDGIFRKGRFMAEKRELQMKEITERLEQGVKELFTSEMYTEYLRTMSQFHNYSFNNTLLIAMQKPDATLVAGYQAWQKKFKRQVRRGEKAIQIIAPAPIREKQEVEKIDPETQEPVLRPDGQPETEEVEIRAFHGSVWPRVFDVSQTDGEPLPELETPELMGSVENFESLYAGDPGSFPGAYPFR